MRWEDAVKVALCYGWIDSTVKSMGEGKRQQYFCPRNPKSTWSALNKSYIEILEPQGLIYESGWKTINQAKETGTWSAMDDIENLVIPLELQKAFKENPGANKTTLTSPQAIEKAICHGCIKPSALKQERNGLRRLSDFVTKIKNQEEISNYIPLISF